MYELSRIRLFSVGPRAARYNDVTLDLRDVGAAVAKPNQPALFGADPADLVRRPSPASVLFLENGGGKSVLMKLIFSVMLPGRRNVVGTTNTRVLEDFVLATDEAHVILEWQHTRSGERVITGKASEWRNHTVSADPNKFSELWYTFRPTAALNLDALPLTVDGRKVTLSGFRDRLATAHRAEPHLQLATSTTPGEWARKLTSLDLDPELFRYQRAMNAGEGEAADAFSFKTDDAFVDFLLRAVTDEQDPQGLAEVVALYAKKLSQRGDLMAERGFVAGALERLEPLADAAIDASAAAELAAGARRQAAQFKAALQQRHADDTGTVEGAKDILAGLERDEASRDQEVRRLNSIHLEVRRLTAKLRLEDAEQRRDELSHDRDAAEALIEAWRAVGPVLQWHSATAQVDGLRLIVEEKQEHARPAQDALMSAAGKLGRKLLATADAATAEAGRLEERAEQVRQRAAAEATAAQIAAAKGAAAQSRLDAVAATVDDINRSVSEAVDRGLVAAGMRLADAADLAEQAWQNVRDDLTAAEDALLDLQTETADAAEQLQTAFQAHTTAQAYADKAADAAETAERRRTELAEQPRLAELLDLDTIDLDADGPTAAGRLQAAISDADAQTVRLKAEERADARVRTALGSGGLLPPSETVIQAVAVLDNEGITAWAGWHYLTQLAADQRQPTMARIPGLVDGIVINNPDHLDAAQRILTAARLLPAALIAVGTTAAMLKPDLPAPAGTAFHLPPNPAMYDEQAADFERRRLAEIHEGRTREMAEIGRTRDGDQDLLSQVKLWLREYPAGTLTRLQDEAAAAQSAATVKHTKAQALKAVHDGLLRRRRELQDQLPHQRAEADRLRRLKEETARLAEQAAKLPALAEESRAEQATVAGAERSRESHTSQATALSEEAVNLRLQAGDQQRIAVACTSDLGEVAGAGSVSRDQPIPAESLEQLRGAHTTAREAYLKVEVGSELMQDLRQAQEREAAARSIVEQLGARRRDQAERLAGTPDAADAPSRAAAVQRAKERHTDLSSQLLRATDEAGGLRKEYEGFVAQERSLEPYGKPNSIEHGEQLTVEVGRAHDQARQAFDKAKSAREDLERSINERERDCDAFAAVIESLADLTPADLATARPFTGDIGSARVRRDEVRANLTDATGLHADAAAKVRSAVDALASFANHEDFRDLTSPLRRQIAGVERDRVADYAVEWRDALRPRLRVLNDELAQLDEHRGSITTRLYGMVETALATLSAAERVSRLPAGLGDWSGQEFLRIRFTRLEPAPMRERLGAVVDEITAAPTDKSKQQRDGMSILLRAVHAALPKGVRVEMLKPDAVLRAERVRVAAISDVFSGGQLLTAAIMLYCTMAALRSNERGRAQLHHAGVLFLDNPIGRASAGYLLDLQIHVAAALGVQLVYTTALFDTTALSAFPLIIRMRNDADLRAGLKYLTVEDEIRRPLDALEPADGSGTITSTRVFIRPRDASE